MKIRPESPMMLPLESNLELKLFPSMTKVLNYKSGILLVNKISDPLPGLIIDLPLELYLFMISPGNY